LYPAVLAWVAALGGPPHLAARQAVARLLSALLVAQSLHPADLLRVLSGPPAVPARQRFKRLARALDRPWLTPARLSPLLIRAALAVVPADPPGGPTAGLTHLALDTVRCGRWEVVVVGVVWHGRVLPVRWAVLPYPWPKGRFGPTVLALLAGLAADWPADRPAHVVADRAFPSRALFACLQAAGWGWTLRVAAPRGGTVAGEATTVGALLRAACPGRWRTWPSAAYGTGRKAVAGALVVGKGLPVVAAHQANPGSQRVREVRTRARQGYLRRKHRAERGHEGGATETDGWVALFTTHPSWRAALASYRRRWAIEGSFRDAQGGWDRRHGWDLEPVLARQATAQRAAALVGLWALGTLLQSGLGDRVGQATAPAAVRAAAAGWTTTGRLSVWARGHLALRDPTAALQTWTLATLAAGPQPAPAPAPAPPLRLVPHPAAVPRAA
jgi:hypothetical protein